MATINIQLTIPDFAILEILSKAKPVQPQKSGHKKPASRLTRKPHDPAAPWGRKKDGTPKKRPGRVAKEKT